VLSVCGFREIRRRGGRTSVMSTCEVTPICVPWEGTALPRDVKRANCVTQWCSYDVVIVRAKGEYVFVSANKWIWGNDGTSWNSGEPKYPQCLLVPHKCHATCPVIEPGRLRWRSIRLATWPDLRCASHVSDRLIHFMVSPQGHISWYLLMGLWHWSGKAVQPLHVWPSFS